MSSQEFLSYLLTVSGINAVIGVALSYLAEMFPGWQENLSPKAKRLLMLVLSFVIPLFATVAMGNLDQESLWAALVVGFMAGGIGFSANQTVHIRELK